MDTQEKPNAFSRRDFLRMGALTVAGAALAGCCPQEPTTDTVVVTEIVQGEEVVKEVPVTVVPELDAEVPTITLMVWGGTERTEADVERFREFYPNPGYEIQVVSPGSHDMEVYQAIRLSVAAGYGIPDLCSMNYGAVAEFATAGLLSDIGELLAPVKDDLLPAAAALSQYDGVFVGLPREIKYKLWYYRKDMFEQAGIVPGEIKTFEDYVAAGEKFHETFPDGYIMNQGPQPIHYMYDGILSHWDDSVIVDKDGNYQLTSNPNFATLFEWLSAMSNSGIAFPTDDWSSDWGPAYADSAIGGWLNFSWGMLHMPSRGIAEQKDLWGVTDWPEFARRGSDSGGSVRVFPTGGQYTAEAVDFTIKERLSYDYVIHLWKQGFGRDSVIRSAMEEIITLSKDFERPEGLSDEDWDANLVNFYGPELFEAALNSMDTSYNIMPYDPAWDAEKAILRTYAEEHIAGNMTVDEALAAAQGDMEAQIGNPWEA